MTRRQFLKTLIFSASSLPFLTIPGNSAENDPEASVNEILLQTSSVAGFQFYDGDHVWPAMQTGDQLTLVAEPDNEYDPQAVKVMWWEKQLGYLPCRENTTVYQMLRRGESVTARISRLQRSQDPWQRVRIEVSLIRS